MREVGGNERLRRVVAVNNSIFRAPFADVLYACDRLWWSKYFDEAYRVCRGEFWTACDAAATVFGINFIESERGGGLSGRPGRIRQGGNSGFQALGLALLFGAARVLLVGYDMQYTQRRSHWHGDHTDLSNPVQSNFPIWVEHFQALAEQAGAEIINCTRETALRCFPRVDLNACLAGAS